MKFSKLKQQIGKRNKDYHEDINELISEHERLINTLSHPNKDKLKRENRIQNKELDKYKKYAKGQ